MTKMRSAITLLITLSVIAMMIALMGVMFKYLDVMRDKAEIKTALIQANILAADIKELLRGILGKKPSKSTMQTLFETPLGLSAESGEFMMSISCDPLANRINIIWLGWGENSKKQKEYALAEALFEMLTEKANLKDAANLREKIETLIQKEEASFLGVPSRINKKKGIITFRKFQQLIDDYRYEVDDVRVYAIPWQQYFSFGIYEQKLDVEFISPELLAYLYDVEIDVVHDSFAMGAFDAFLLEIGETRSTNGYDKWLFSKKTLDIAQCKVNYMFRKGTYGFQFNYLKGRIEGFEFLGN